MIFWTILTCKQGCPMAMKLPSVLIERLSSYIALGESRLETLALLITGMIGARTVNLSHIASERGSTAKHASTYRRLQRFFSSMSSRARIGRPI